MEQLRLYDVEDASRFVAAIAQRSGLTLSFHDRADLEQYLLVEIWQLSLRYQAGGISFSTYAGNTLRRRSVDWIRNGRTRWVFGDGRVHERPRVELLSLDAERDSLGETLGTVGGDPAASSDPDGGGLHAERDRQRVRDLYALGLEPPRRAA